MAKSPRSALEAALDKALEELYPYDAVKSDWPIKVKGKTLYVDRVLLGPKIAIEADGRQHSEYTEHFHRDADGFRSSKERDALKVAWLEANGFTLVRFDHKEEISAATLRTKILEALDEQV
jgi:very-short-patch-repair endonuclease